MLRTSLNSTLIPTIFYGAIYRVTNNYCPYKTTVGKRRNYFLQGIGVAFTKKTIYEGNSGIFWNILENTCVPVTSAKIVSKRVLI